MREHAVNDHVVRLQQVAQARVVPQQEFDGLIHLVLRCDLRPVIETRIQRTIDLEKVDPIQVRATGGRRRG